MTSRADGPPLQDLGLAALRIFAGLSLALAHGFGKLPPAEGFVGGVAEMGFPAPLLFAWAAGCAESVGGMLLAVGLFTRPAACFIVVTMSVATFLKQAGDPYLERELSLLFGIVALAFCIAGSGKFGLDRLLEMRRGRRGRPRRRWGRRDQPDNLIRTRPPVRTAGS